MQELPQSTEPSGRGQELLEEWAAYAKDDSYDPSWGQSCEPRTEKGYHGDPPDRWFIVNTIVCRLRDEHDHIYRVIAAYYLRDKPMWMIARDLGRAEEIISSDLCWAAELVGREYRDWKSSG